MKTFASRLLLCHVLFLFVLRSEAQNRCALWHHSGMLRSWSIYVDGGVELYRENGTTTIGFNNDVLEIGMGESWDVTTNFTETVGARFGSAGTGSNPPAMVRGALYRGPTNDSKLYTYGGSTFLANTSAEYWQSPSDDTYSVWSFDTVASVWDQYDITDQVPVRPNWGAWTEWSGAGLAFSLNGQTDRGSDNFLYSQVEYVGEEQESTGNDTSYHGGLIVFNLNNHTACNRSTETLGDPRVAGGMIYVGSIGTQGILLALGGMRSSGTGTDTFTNGRLIDFETVALTDSFLEENVTWYNQTTSGQIPAPRIDFCLLPTEELAADNSSKNIYIYGGYDPSTSKIYDDVYVLSLPSFTWTQVYTGAIPRFGHTCNRAGNRQMVIIGGALDARLYAVETTGNLPSDLNNITCDPTGGISLFDVSNLTWSSFYNRYSAPYQVPQPVVDVIGGTGNGNATLTRPIAGFSLPTISTIFNPALTPSTSSSHTSLTGGAIAGIVIAIIVLLVLLLLLYLYLRRRKTREAAQTLQDSATFPPVPKICHEVDAEEGVCHEVSCESECKELGTGFECAELGTQGEKVIELEGEWEAGMKEKEKEEKEKEKEKQKNKEVLVQSEGEIAELEGWAYK